MLPLTATAADWLQAIGGIVTAAVALFLLGQGAGDRRAQRLAQTRAQASRVSVSEGRFDFYTPSGDRFEAQVSAEVRNDSEDVISRVEVTWHYFHNDSPGIPQGEVSKWVGRLGKGDDVRVTAAVDVERLGKIYPEMLTVHTTMTFVDLADRRWERDSEHVLREIIFVDNIDSSRGRRRVKKLERKGFRVF